MNRKTVSGIMLTLLLIGVLTLAFNIQPVRSTPSTIIVPDDYATIQEAINAAFDGDTVYVKSGIYYENVVVNKTVSLIGENRNTTVIDGGGTGIVLKLVVNNVAVINFTIQRGGMWFDGGGGIKVDNYHHNSVGNIISGNVVTENHVGVELHASNNNVIIGNFLINNKWRGGIALSLSGANDNKIVENIVMNNEGYGIFSSYSYRNNLTGNIVMDNYIGMYIANSGSHVMRKNNMTSNAYNFGVWGYRSPPHLNWLNHDIDTSNKINGKPIYFWVDEHDKQIPSDAGYIAIIDSTNISIRDVILTSNSQGILIVYTTNSTIENIMVSKTFYGIIIQCSNYINIQQNKIIANNNGIWIDESTNINIVGNNVTNNEYFGIYIVEAVTHTRPVSANIYHNNFLENPIHAYQASVHLANVTWDDGYPSGGNYWSGYEERYPNATEIDGSGIWSTPYVIDENNQDNYPLMEPWTPKPLTPIEASEELIETIESWNLPEGTENSLTSKLDDVIHLLEKGNDNGALHKLMDFIDQVEGLRGKKLTDDQADYLIAEAQSIIDLIQG